MHRELRQFNTNCWKLLLKNINSNQTLPSCSQILKLNDNECEFEFLIPLTIEQKDILDLILLSWECPVEDVAYEIGDGIVISDTQPSSEDIIWSSTKVMEEIDRLGGPVLYADDIGDMHTTDRSFVERSRFSFSSLDMGSYIVSWSFSVLISSHGKACNYRIKTEGDINETIHTTDIVGSSDKDFYASDFTDVSGFKKINLYGNFDIVFEYKSKNSGNSICIRDVKISLRRI